MKLDNIGAILKKRIKECGFTQEKFAEETGIGLSSLKKYISGKVCYTVECLEVFANKLQCSYDYLLGKTEAPQPELQEIKDRTRLANGTIERLLSAAKNYDYDGESYVKVYDFLIQNDGLLAKLKEYLELDEEEEYIFYNQNGIEKLNDCIEIGEQWLRVPDIADACLMGVIRELITQKSNYGKDIPGIRRNFRYRAVHDLEQK